MRENRATSNTDQMRGTLNFFKFKIAHKKRLPIKKNARAAQKKGSSKTTADQSKPWFEKHASKFTKRAIPKVFNNKNNHMFYQILTNFPGNIQQ